MTIDTNSIISGIGSSATVGNSSSAGKAVGMATRAAVVIARKAAAPFLDSLVATPIGAWGFTKMRSAYAGACCKVRRVSDSATLDIGFLADGIVNTQLMIAFAGSSTLTLDTLYDQSGGILHLTQATAANQPDIDLVFLRNGMPGIIGSGTKNMTVPAGVSITSTANCAVWAAVGSFSNRVATVPWNFGTDTQFNLNLTPSSAFSVQPSVSGTKLSFATMASIPNANGCVVGLNSAAGGMTYYRNDYSVSRVAASAVAVTGGNIPGNNINYGFVDLYACVVFNAALSTADAGLIQYGMSAAYSCVITPQAQVVLCGDSIVASTSGLNNYNKVLSAYLPDSVAVYNTGLSGQTLQSESTEVSNYITPLFKSGIGNVCILLGGVNDIATSRTGAQVIADATTWHTATKAAGFKTLQAVLYPRAVTGGYTAAMEVERVTFNAWVRANYGTGKTLDGIVDFELEPTFLPTISTADFPDNLHPSLRGYRKATPIIADAVTAQMFGMA